MPKVNSSLSASRAVTLTATAPLSASGAPARARAATGARLNGAMGTVTGTSAVPP